LRKLDRWTGVFGHSSMDIPGQVAMMIGVGSRWQVKHEGLTS